MTDAAVQKAFPRNDVLDEARGQPSRMLGFGAAPGSVMRNGRTLGPAQDMIGMIRKCMDTPSYALPTIESVTNYFGGPVSNANLTNSFGSIINPLQPSALAGAEAQSSTFAEVGKFQTYVLILALQWRMDIEPINWTLKGNSIPGPPNGATSSGAKPVSPDAFTVTTGAAANTDGAANGVLGLQTANSMKQATLEWGWWQDIASYFMARAYNLQWKYGNNFLFMNENLQYTMHVPSNAQEGTGSSSEIDPLFMARLTNAYYLATLGGGNQFATINYSRFGNQNLGAAGQSVFHPTRAYDTIGVSYGGAGSRSVLRCNSEWKRLSCPILCGPGVPLGLTAVQQVQDFVNAMQAWLDPNFGLGTNDFTESTVIATGATVNSGTSFTSGTTGVEPSFDSPVANNSLSVFADRVVFKGGRWSLTLGFKGVEMSPDQAALYKDNTTRQMIAANTGVAISPKQVWHA